MPQPTALEQLLMAADASLRTLFAAPRASRQCPTLPMDTSDLTPTEKAQSGALMRVNHVGDLSSAAARLRATTSLVIA